MVSVPTLVAFALVSIPLILAPGPNVLFVIGRSLSLGKIGGLLSVIGTALGGLVVVTGVALGVGLIIAQSVVLFTIVKVAGAGYIIYLGIQAIRHRNARADAIVGSTAPSALWRILLQGFLVGISNPKTIVFFVAVLPQFVDYSAGSVATQMFILGAVFIVIALITDGIWALAAGIARDWFARSPKRIAALSASGGIVMIGLGVGSLFIGSAKEA